MVTLYLVLIWYFYVTQVLRADPATNYVALKLDWADKSSCVQRMGR